MCVCLWIVAFDGVLFAFLVLWVSHDWNVRKDKATQRYFIWGKKRAKKKRKKKRKSTQLEKGRDYF